MYLDYSSSHNVSFYLLLFIIIQTNNQLTMSKFSKNRKVASVAASAATKNVYETHSLPNLGSELKSLQLKSKQVPTQDSEEVLLANTSPKP